MWIFLVASLLAAQESPQLTRARQQLEVVRQEAAQGLVPMAAVATAQEEVNDAADLTILNRTLYAQLRPEDLSAEQADEMIAAAQRRADRIRHKLDDMQKLVDAGVAERRRATDLEAELVARTKAVDEANGQAALVRQIVAVAHAESDQAIAVDSKTKEHFAGDHALEEADIREITLAFEKRFREPLPISARGETAVHRALGFDHTGRIDVALTPDSAEGVWLRGWLETHEVSYFAFRAAVPGKATAAHIHIGPPSTRLHVSD